MAAGKISSPLAILVSCLLPFICGNTYYIGKGFEEKGVCTYKGYVPGGGKPNIKPITAPTAQMPANALAKIVGLGSKSTALAMHSSNLLKSFAKGGKAFLKLAPKLAPALGVFGVALGFVADFTKPSPQDILNQANKAIAKLTTEVNDRLVKMEGYVDFRVINLEKDLVNREYRSLFNLFGSCINEATKDKVNECMRDAVKKAASDSPKYMILDTKIGVYTNYKHDRGYYDKYPSKAPSYYDVKRLEAGIISFRDYANLHLLMIATLLNTYKSDASLPNAAHYVRYYTGQQKRVAIKYANYAHWAYNWIYARNVGEDLNNRFKHSCKKAYAIKEGWFVKVHTADRSKCKLECSGMPKPAECSYSVTVRADGKKPSSYFRVYLGGRYSTKGAAENYGRLHKSRSICGPYLSSLRKDIETYYNSVLLNNAKIWKEIADKTSGDPPESDVIEIEFSKDFPDRLERAEKLARDQYFDTLRKDDDGDERLDGKLNPEVDEVDEEDDLEEDDDMEDDGYKFEDY